MKLRAFLQEEDLASVLGIEKDLVREKFLNAVKVLKAEGVEVEVFDAIKDKEFFRDLAIIPCFEVNGKMEVSGHYPSNQDLAKYFKIDFDKFDKTSAGGLLAAANDGRIGFCCGVGTDVYLDPNEEE